LRIFVIGHPSPHVECGYIIITKSVSQFVLALMTNSGERNVTSLCLNKFALCNFATNPIAAGEEATQGPVLQQIVCKSCILKTFGYNIGMLVWNIVK